MKKNNYKKLFNILIVIDDFADDVQFCRHSKLLHSLFTRGRHNYISTIVATQKFTAIHPIIRVNATELYVYRLRNNKDLETFLDEVSGSINKKTLLDIYRLATKDPYSFLFCNLVAKKVEDMFYQNFNHKIVISDI
jgi:hypothetical protein